MSAAELMPLPDPEDPGPELSVVPSAPAGGDECSTWDDNRLVAEITAAERQSRALTARAVRLSAEFARRHPTKSEKRAEDDLSSTALDELSVASGLARGAFAYRLRDAVDLDRRYPKLLDAWEAGLLPWAAVRKVLEAGSGLSDECCPRLESELLTRIGRPTHPDLATMPLRDMLAIDDDTAMTLSSRATTAAVGRLVRDALTRIEPAARARRARAATASRRVFFEAQSDGMGTFGGYVPQAVGWASYERVDALARAIPDHPDDTRTLDAKRADVMTDLLLGTQVERPGESRSTEPTAEPAGSAAAAVGTGRGAPLVPVDLRRERDDRPAVVPVQLHVLLDHTRCRPGTGGCPAEAGRLGPVTAETVADLLALAVDSGGQVSGAHVVEQTCPGPEHQGRFGPGPYEPGEPLKRYVRARQRRCVWPGCGRPARACELDHSVPYPEGPTCECNLAPQCAYHHHHVKHHPGRDGRPPWRLVNHGRGHLTWITPSRRRIDVWPDLPDVPDPPPARSLDPPPF